MSSHSYFSRLLKKNLWIYFFSFLMAPIGYIIKIVITGSVSSEDYGVLSAVMSFVLMLGAYNDFGMAESLNFFLPEYLHTKDKKKITQTFSIALLTQLVSSTILATVLYFCSNILAEYYFENTLAAALLHIFILFFFLDNILRSMGMFLQAVQDTKVQKSIEFLRLLSQMGLIIWIAVGGAGSVLHYAWTYNYSTIIILFVACGWIAKKYSQYFTITGWRFGKGDFMRIFQYAIFVMLSANISTLLSQLDMQMITVMLGTTNAGFYNIYLSMIRIPFMILLPGVYFLFPVFSDLFKRGDYTTIKRIHGFCYEFFAIAALFTTSFYYIFGDSLTQVLFGPEYSIAGKILLYSAPFLIFDFLLQIDFQILSATGKPRTKMFILLAAVGLNFVTNYIFLKLWGVVGSAFATGLGWIFIWFLAKREVKNFSGIFRWKGFLKNIVGVAIMSGILYIYLDLQVFLHTRWQLFYGIIGVGMFYTCVFLVLNFSEFQRFYSLLTHKEKIVG